MVCFVVVSELGSRLCIVWSWDCIWSCSAVAYLVVEVAWCKFRGVEAHICKLLYVFMKGGFSVFLRANGMLWFEARCVRFC